MAGQSSSPPSCRAPPRRLPAVKPKASRTQALPLKNRAGHDYAVALSVLKFYLAPQARFKLLHKNSSPPPKNLAWNIPAVVAEEKFTCFTSIESFLRVSKYIKAVVVLAVPLPPTISTGCRCFFERQHCATKRWNIEMKRQEQAVIGLHQTNRSSKKIIVLTVQRRHNSNGKAI